MPQRSTGIGMGASSVAPVASGNSFQAKTVVEPDLQ